MRMSHRVVWFAAALWLALTSLAEAQGLPMGKADELGFAPDRLARITETLKANIDQHDIPGAVLLIARHGKVAYFESMGALDPQGKAPMGKDAIFRIYSMSKPITTVAAMMLFEEGRITLDGRSRCRI
jgi:CubicO group peptidase (beta-lactamase class C family)